MDHDMDRILAQIAGLIAMAAGYLHLRRLREAHPTEPTNQHDELALVRGDDNATGCHARSIGEPMGSPMVQHNNVASGPFTCSLDDVDTSHASSALGPSSSLARSKKSGSKRSRHINDEDEGLQIAKRLGEVAKELGVVDQQEWSNRLYAALMEMTEFPESILEDAFEYLMHNKTDGQMFLGGRHAARATWLEKCSNRKL